jgi:hypothetical protein
MDDERTTIYASFGPGPTQEIPLDWTEYIITQLYERYPKIWVKLLPEAANAARNGRK